MNFNLLYGPYKQLLGHNLTNFKEFNEYTPLEYKVSAFAEYLFEKAKSI